MRMLLMNITGLQGLTVTTKQGRDLIDRFITTRRTAIEIDFVIGNCPCIGMTTIIVTLTALCLRQQRINPVFQIVIAKRLCFRQFEYHLDEYEMNSGGRQEYFHKIVQRPDLIHK